MNDFKNLHDLLSRLPDELSCRLYFEKFRWEEGKPICPYCGSGRAYRIEKGRRFKCGNPECYKKYSVLVGTIFEASNIPLQKWFIALYMATAHKKGISSCQLARDLGVTQKTAWFMLHRIRHMMESGLSKQPFGDIVQADEAFIGGRNSNRHADKKVDLSQGRAYKDKTPVLGVMQYGQVVLKVLPNTQGETMRQALKTMIKKEAILVSDNFDAYGWMRGHCFHIIINHSIGQYSSGAFHTNSIEGFWSQLKRMIIGVYHQISRKHLQRYCDEMSFRFNSRKTNDANRFRISLGFTQGRLKYDTLINKSLSSSNGQEFDQIPQS
jgi:transposase-like protein